MADKVPDSTATLLPSCEAQETLRISSTPNNPKVRDFLRHTRLQILGKVFGRFTGSRQEIRKIAIYDSRLVAAFHCLLHLIPLGGAITLLLLRWTHYWIGHDPPSATTLQFVAKFHELLMQVSIVEIVLCIVRSEATRGFVPLGALSGAVQTTQLSYLWSLDFLSMFTSDAFRGRIWSKVCMIVAIAALFILTALVGPSSAILMIPEPGCPKHMDPKPIFMPSNESYYPTHLNSSNGLNAWNMALLNPTIRRFKNDDSLETKESAHPEPFNFDRSLRLSARSTERRVRPTDSGVRPLEFGVQTTLSGGRRVRWSAEEATSIEPTVFANHVLQASNSFGAWAKSNETRSITLPSAVTTVTCITPEFGTVLEPNDDVYYISKNGSSVRVLGSINSMALRVNGSGLFNNDTILADGSKANTTYQYFDPIWLNAPESDSPALVVVLFSWRTNATELQPLDRLIAEVNDTSTPMPLEVVTCTISAYWKTVQASLTWNQGLTQATETEPIAELKPREVRNITLNTTGIDMVYDPDFIRGLRYWPSISFATAFGLTISSLQSLYAIRRTDFSYHETSQQWGYNLVEPKETIKVTDMQIIKYAYGYTTAANSVRLSLTVILAYCIVTIAYLVHILITGSTSTAWNSAIELVALALQSKKPDYPGHPAVGIDSLDTFSQGVGIRVNSDNELELVFASDRDLDRRGLRKIEKNVAY